MTRNLMLAAVVAGALCLLPRPALAAATFTVNSTLDTVDATPGDGVCADALGRCTLRAAVMEANALSGADTILVPAGTYTLAIGGINENAAATGDLDITDALTITGTSGDPSTVIIDGANLDKVISIDPLWNKSFATTIQNVTIENGHNISPSAGDGYGGALDFDGFQTGTLTIANCVIMNSRTDLGPGGGLAVTASGPSASGSVTISHTRISGNSAPADSGGGLWVGSGVVVNISDSVIENNTTGSAGGGIAFTVDPPNGAAHSVTTSTIAGNSVTGVSSFQGGGIYATAALTVANSTIYGNTTASNNGSGLYSSQYPGKPLTLTNVTITGNTAAGAGGALVHQNTSGGSTALVNNSIIAGNNNGDVGGALMATSANNLIGTGGSGGLSNGTNGNQVGVASPGLGSLTTINSWQKVIPLLPGSPALDAGNNSLATGTDQRGGPRMLDAADADTTQTVDIGAYEASPMIALIANQSMNAGADKTVTFNMGDGSQPIVGTATSSNTAAVPNGALSVTGNGSTRTLTIAGGAVASGTATITVTLSYNGASVSTTFTLTVTATPDLTIAKSHSGNFRQGQTGSYTLTVTNAGSGATAGAVTVTDTLPAGLTASALSGTGWSCTVATLTCTRSDALAAGAAYPPITAAVNVAANAGPSLTNTAAVSGGGEANTANDTASDPTTVLQNTTTALTAPNATYGGSVTFTATVTGGVAGNVQFALGGGIGPVGTVAVSGGTATLPYTARIAPGAYTVTATFTPTDPTYLASSQSQPFTVAKAPLTVTADSLSRAYGSANPAFTATYSGLVAGDTAASLGGALTFSTAASQSSLPGPFAVTPDGLSSPNYAITFVDGTLTVTKAPLTVTADNQSRAYGSANPTLTATISGFVLGEDASVLTGTLSVTTTAVATSGAGTYPITPSGLSAVNYDITFVPGTLTVNKVALAVTAADAGRLFGDANPAFSATYSGFVLSDDQSVLGGTLTFATPATPDSSAGSYPVTPSGLTSPNYSFIYIDGHLTITPAPLTITANDKSRLYGDANPAFDASYAGFKRGQTSSVLSGVLAFTTPAAAGSAPGTYTITPAGLSSGNYDITYVPGTLTVSRRPLTVTADNLSKAYGDANPALTVSYSGFAPGEDATVLGGTLSVTTTATATSGAGAYPITPAGITSGNYTISFVGGTLTVVQAPLTVTVDSVSRAYGDANPPFTATYTGFVLSETPAVLTGTLTYTTAATAASNAGSYSVTASGLGSPNYNISFVPGTLTVTQRALTVTAEDKHKTYGDANPAFTATYAGFAPGEDASVLGGTLQFVTAAAAASAPGTYAITPAGYTSANYSFSYVPGNLTVARAPLTVQADGVSRAYGSANPVFSVTYSGFVLGQTEAVLGGSLMITTAATPSSGAGTYALTPSGLTSANYDITFADGTLTVGQAPLTVTADSVSRAYGSANPVFSVTYTGFVLGQTEAVLGGALTFNTAAVPSSAPGTYPLTAAGLTSANYALTFVDGAVTVSKAPLTIKADDQHRPYGTANPTLTATYTGLVLGQDASALGGTLTIDTAALQGSAPGTYPINIGGLTSANYDITFTGGTLTVAQAPLTIKADDKTKLTGAPNPPLTVTYTGFVLGEDATALAGALSVTTTATDTSTPGTYPIVVAGVSSANYAITFVPGTLTVTRPAPPPTIRSLTVVVNNASRPFGQPNPPLTGTVAGLLPEDGITVSYTTTATVGSLPGDYPITPAFSDPNGKLALYTKQITPGTLTVLPALVTVTVDNAARSYGDQNPKFTAQIAGLPDGARLQVDLATAATRESPVGSYAIQAQVTAKDDGLQVAVVPGTLTVTKAPLTVTPRDADRLYGAENPPLTGKVDGVRNQDQIAAAYSTTATRTSPPGAYPITATLSDPNGKLGNYAVTLRQGTLTVRDCREITVTKGAGGEPDAHIRCPLGPEAGRQAVQDLTGAPGGSMAIVGAATAQVEDAIARAQIESAKAPRILLESSSDAAVQGAVIDQEALTKLAEAGGELGVKTSYGALLMPPAVVAKLSGQTEGGQLVVLFEQVAVTGAERFKPASPVVEVTVATRRADGTLERHEQFAVSLTLTLPLTDGSADPELAGIYRFTTDADGNVTGVQYVGGTLDSQPGTISVPRESLSKYGVLIYDREYADVAGDFWAYRAIKVMTARHVVQGVSDTLFDPQRAVTRAEFAAMVARAFGVPIDPTPVRSFADVPGDKWYAPVMSAVVQAGLYSPEAGNTLRPDVPITRQEMAMVIARAMERFYPAAALPNPDADQVLAPFSDHNELTAAATGDVARLVAAGLIRGRAPDSLAPNGVTTRAEAVTLIKRLLDWGSAQ